MVKCAAELFITRLMPKPAPRQQQMLRMLEEKGTLNVTELSEQFAVSLVTVRKDLDDLERQGLLQRTFGGAVFSHRSRFNSSFVEKTNQNLPQSAPSRWRRSNTSATATRSCWTRAPRR